MSEISRIAYYLALIGGILLVIFGLLSLIGYAFAYIGSFISFGFAYFGIVSIICGIIAIIGAKKRVYSCLGYSTHCRWNHRRWTWRTISNPRRTYWTHRSNNQERIDNSNKCEFDRANFGVIVHWKTRNLLESSNSHILENSDKKSEWSTKN
jgi:hypothetical protein